MQKDTNYQDTHEHDEVKVILKLHLEMKEGDVENKQQCQIYDI